MGPERIDPSSDLSLLRRKLDALCYDDPLDEKSAPLVQQLVDDLIRVTEGYRAQKTQLAKCHQEIDDAHAQVRPYSLRTCGLHSVSLWPLLGNSGLTEEVFLFNGLVSLGPLMPLCEKTELSPVPLPVMRNIARREGHGVSCLKQPEQGLSCLEQPYTGAVREPYETPQSSYCARRWPVNMCHVCQRSSAPDTAKQMHMLSGRSCSEAYRITGRQLTHVAITGRSY